MAKIIKSNSSDPIIKMNNIIDKETMKKVKRGVIKSNSMKKFASGISMTAPNFYNPLYTQSSLSIPRDRKAVNVWSRHFYSSEAIVATVINLYASLPITAWSIECENPHVLKQMEDMCKRLKLRDILQGIAQEYFVIGDVFIMSELDEENKTWKRLVVLNPDQVEVRRNVLADAPVIQLIPDDDIKKIVFDRNPKEMYDYFRMFLPDVIQAVKNGGNIDIDPAHITHLKHMPVPYGVYGSPFLKPVFKTLMYKEMLRRAQFVIAERYVTPLKIFKLGTMEEPPAQEEIDAMQMQLDAVMNDPSLVLVTTQRLTCDWQGINGKTLNLSGEYDFTERETLFGLGVSESFLNANGPSYSDSSIGGNAFVQKLENFRETLKEYIEEKILKPICELNGYYDTDPDTDEEFLIPVEFKWEALRLQDEGTRQNALLGLRQSSLLSAKTLLQAYHINPETEAINLTEERDTIFDMNRILARQLKITQETQMGLQYEFQKLMGGAGAMAGMPPQAAGAPGGVDTSGGMPPPQGTPAAPPGQQGSTPPPGGNYLSSLPSGSFTPPGGSAGGRPAIASLQNLDKTVSPETVIRQMLKEVKAKIEEVDRIENLTKLNKTAEILDNKIDNKSESEEKS